MTLNQIISSILHFGRNHGQLNTAEFKRVSDWLNAKNVYAALFCDLVRVSKPVNMLSYILRIHIVDVVTPEGHNEAEVFSDAVLIAHDLISYLAQSEDIYTIEPGAFTPVSEQTGDMLTGIYFDLTINVTAPNNTCAIPFKSDSVFSEEFHPVFG